MPKGHGSAGVCSDFPGRDCVLLLPYPCLAELQFYCFCFHQQLPEISQLYYLLLVLLPPLKLSLLKICLQKITLWKTDLLDWFLASCFSLSHWKSVSMLLFVFTVPNACCSFFVVTSLSANFIVCKLRVLHDCFLVYFRTNNNTKWTF